MFVTHKLGTFINATENSQPVGHLQLVNMIIIPRAFHHLICQSRTIATWFIMVPQNTFDPVANQKWQILI